MLGTLPGTDIGHPTHPSQAPRLVKKPRELWRAQDHTAHEDPAELRSRGQHSRLASLLAPIDPIVSFGEMLFVLCVLQFHVDVDDQIGKFLLKILGRVLNYRLHTEMKCKHVDIHAPNSFPLYSTWPGDHCAPWFLWQMNEDLGIWQSKSHLLTLQLIVRALAMWSLWTSIASSIHKMDLLQFHNPLSTFPKVKKSPRNYNSFFLMSLQLPFWQQKLI